MTITKPTALTRLQYKKGLFAIDRSNGDHYLVFGNVGTENVLDNSLWVCQDSDSLENTDPVSHPSYEVTEISVGDSGEIEVVTFKTSESFNELDLEKLSDGILSWK